MTQRLAAALVAVTILGAACSGTTRTTAAFCDELARSTGPDGVEVVFAIGNPARLDGVVTELESLHDRAPDDISTTTAALLNFFRSYQRAPRDERRDLLAENEEVMLDASTALNDYALNECGLLLQRAAPTPIPTVNPGVEIAPE